MKSKKLSVLGIIVATISAVITFIPNAFVKYQEYGMELNYSAGITNVNQNMGIPMYYGYYDYDFITMGNSYDLAKMLGMVAITCIFLVLIAFFLRLKEKSSSVSSFLSIFAIVSEVCTIISTVVLEKCSYHISQTYGAYVSCEWGYYALMIFLGILTILSIVNMVTISKEKKEWGYMIK